MRIAILSPNPSSNSGGVERFCHTLHEVVTRLGGSAAVVDATQLPQTPHEVVVTNGMLGARTGAARIHVYHGCWVKALRLFSGTGTESAPWKARSLVVGAAREVRAGRGAYRVAVSGPTATELRHWYRARIHRVIPNGIDTEMFAIGDRHAARHHLGLATDERIALFVGRAEPRKRPDIAATAAQRAGYRLVAAGAGGFAGADPLGVLAPSELSTWVTAADCVLAPSEYEACSLAILEALSCGTPVVASRVGYVLTLIDDVPGYRELTAPVGDVDAFTAALFALPQRREAAAAATAYVRDHNNLDRFAAHWAAAFEDALRAVPARR